MDFTFKVLENTRGILKKIIENNTLENLNKIPKGFNNNIIWNIAHVVVSEQLLAYKLSGLDSTLSDDMINTYRKDTKPNGDVSQAEVDEIKDLLLSTLEKTKEDYYDDVFENYNAYTVSTTGNTLTNIDEALQFVAIHEGLHYGYILALLKAIKN
ncbi:DinB superfamily protein [Hyunsoonleella jejuensis]|uniref:DinB superfamily protein n=1 Tax=Hyunsoonleella jejuensis TaxID=419940 RepID=A0A1H9APH1_9FLAO|nr:DinB family protein [Hyunsoonleella jejuensis]SEP78664.1 DinB superfamily protein [Hyunsoonleella jejuensis]